MDRNGNDIADIQKSLFEMSEVGYKAFSEKLMPTVAKERVLGVRVPKIRALAGKIFGTPLAESFMKALPHKYFEEDNLHAFLIEKIKDFDACCEALLVFLPHVDNWATCDSMTPTVFKKKPEGLLEFAFSLMESNHTYTVRYGIGILMKFFLDGSFAAEALERVASICSDEYYVKMMQAWFFQVALSKNWEEALPYLKERWLDPWVHNKAISKSIESFRMSELQKSELRQLKIKP